jgi:hypothetical protein
MKYELGQAVWYMAFSEIRKDTITERSKVVTEKIAGMSYEDNFHPDTHVIVSREEEPFDFNGIYYKLSKNKHGLWNEDELFASKEELIKSL